MSVQCWELLCSALPGCSAHSNQGSFGSYLPFYFCEMSHADLLMGTFLPPCSATKTVISSAAIPAPASPGPHCYLWWLGEEPPEFTQSLPDTHRTSHSSISNTPCSRRAEHLASVWTWKPDLQNHFEHEIFTFYQSVEFLPFCLS